MSFMMFFLYMMLRIKWALIHYSPYLRITNLPDLTIYIEWKQNLDIVLTAEEYKFCINEPKLDQLIEDASKS